MFIGLYILFQNFGPLLRKHTLLCRDICLEFYQSELIKSVLASPSKGIYYLGLGGFFPHKMIFYLLMFLFHFGASKDSKVFPNIKNPWGALLWHRKLHWFQKDLLQIIYYSLKQKPSKYIYISLKGIRRNSWGK